MQTESNKERKRLYNKQYAQREREYCKRLHICRYCKSQDAYTLSGRTLCAECAAEEAERKRRKRAKDKEYRKAQNESVKRWRDNNADKGICSYCGKRKTDGIHKTCDYCRQKLKEQARERRAKTQVSNYPRGENGYCYQCNKNMAIPGYKLCKECYDRKIIIALDNFELATQKGFDL